MKKLNENQLNEIEQYLTQATNTKHYRKLLTVKLWAHGKTQHEIIEITGTPKSTLQHWVHTYKNQGINQLLQDRRGGRYNQTVTVAQEREFFKQVEAEADNGYFVTIHELWCRFNKTFDCSMAKSTFYSVLKRNNWRKVTPRKIHPKKVDDATIEASKKLRLKSAN